MKDFMANGRFSRGVEVIADASLAFNGNIDYSIAQLVDSSEHDLFIPLPKEVDLAIMDRFACYLPGWEMPKTSSEYLTGNYGFITDYLAEAFHHMFAHTNRYEEVTKRIRLGPNVEGRDEKGIKKMVGAYLKILHPDGPPNDAEFEEYVSYAVEARRRVKEQMNKRKPDEEFARINLSYFTADGKEVVVYCPESRNALATQHPSRRSLNGWRTSETVVTARKKQAPAAPPAVEHPLPSQDASTLADLEIETGLKEKHFTIFYGDTGYSYETIMGPYLQGAKAIEVEDPYIRMPHQIQNFVRLCETVVKLSNIKRIDLLTGYDDEAQRDEIEQKLGELKQSLLEADVLFEFDFNPNMHDREIRIDNGWVVKIGRGLDFYQKPSSWFELGTNDLTLRKCLETKVDIYRRGA
jgi:ATP-dependent Lon protease